MANRWQVLATSADQVRSLVELRDDGVVWIREGLTPDEVRTAVLELVHTIRALQQTLHSPTIPQPQV